ncbi:hypothetical protein [Sphingobium sp. GW456-12-10-14-TSB1]|uniref:hypothetical protein n=1 Tax=Sphingobium sp. GW456-12-10-14-TSB1 TaxID=1987165 RepID=UPI001C3C72A9|nr:hypothetical protein [Sphingobium sp. GW456-12-10-14-TSB1]
MRLSNWPRRSHFFLKWKSLDALCWPDLPSVAFCLLIYEQLNSIDIAVLFVVMDEKANSPANLDTETPAIARRPGRPKGQPKAPGSGRKPGTPNRHTRDVRAAAAKHSTKAIAALVKLLGHEDGKVIALAAREILDRAHGRPMTPTEMTGKDGAPLIPEVSQFDVARRMAFLLNRAAKEKATADKPLPPASERFAAQPRPEVSSPPPPPAPPPAPIVPDDTQRILEEAGRADREMRAERSRPDQQNFANTVPNVVRLRPR